MRSLPWTSSARDTHTYQGIVRWADSEPRYHLPDELSPEQKLTSAREVAAFPLLEAMTAPELAHLRAHHERIAIHQQAWSEARDGIWGSLIQQAHTEARENGRAQIARPSDQVFEELFAQYVTSQTHDNALRRRTKARTGHCFVPVNGEDWEARLGERVQPYLYAGAAAFAIDEALKNGKPTFKAHDIRDILASEGLDSQHNNAVQNLLFAHRVILPIEPAVNGETPDMFSSTLRLNTSAIEFLGQRAVYAIPPLPE